ncbi:MAG: hypothetical protein HPY45_14265 [Anaerolineae bacterium]|nr:hypothetical protein [Anaerolineae bacterium]
MSSIYHFFFSLVKTKSEFVRVDHLDNFPFDERLLSCRNKGVFPDLAIRISKQGETYSGGELIELKDSKTYSVASFNSTIPSSRKKTTDIIVNTNSLIYKQMREKGENPEDLPERQVFYLVRGRKSGCVKVCLVHGSFFETVQIKNLIQQSFAQVLEEGLMTSGEHLSEEVQQKLTELLSRQDYFRRVRDVPNASVKLRFRIMTEVKAQANILDSRRYPQIKENSLNLILPLHGNREQLLEQFQSVGKEENVPEAFETICFKHPLNGDFLVFQTMLLNEQG